MFLGVFSAKLFECFPECLDGIFSECFRKCLMFCLLFHESGSLLSFQGNLGGMFSDCFFECFVSVCFPWRMFLSIFRNVCWSMFSGRRNIFLMFSGKFKVFKKHIKTNSQNVYGTVTHFWVNIFFLTSKAKNYRNI